MGGSLYSTTEHGADTASVVLRLLTGAATPEHPTEASSSKANIRLAADAALGDQRSQSPRGQPDRYFRELSAWQRYSWQIAFVSAVVLIQAGLDRDPAARASPASYCRSAVRQRMAELAHINRFSTAGELTASIAHEINQPLGSILTNAETAQSILQSSHPDIDELKDIVDDILRDDRRASEVIRRMRSLLKKAPFEPRVSTSMSSCGRQSSSFGAGRWTRSQTGQLDLAGCTSNRPRSHPASAGYS